MSNKNKGSKLRKELGLFSGVSLVAGMTIGSGPCSTWTKRRI